MEGSAAHGSHNTEIILDSIADGVFTVDREWRITSFNRAAERITGIQKQQAIGRHCWDVFRASICERECSLRQTMETGESIGNRTIFIVNSQGERVPVSISTALLKDERGKVIGGVESFRDLSVVEALRKELQGKQSFFDIISKNKEMLRLFGILEQVAESEATVLLIGESGTGKELFARAIHSLSSRKSGPMVPVNCGALPDNLLESELFGYKAGAFTGAARDKPGRFTVASGGTIFLDEIGDISPALQSRLLRVLENKTYEPLGSNLSMSADVRVVAATNRDLEGMVASGEFRRDLYYRINVVTLRLPPLRERTEDIPLLAEHFVRKYSGLMGKEIKGISPEVMSMLMGHKFPGNVRDLENIMEYSVVVCRGPMIDHMHLPDSFCGNTGDDWSGEIPTWDDAEAVFILQALARNSWHKTRTASQLGIHPSTLWRKMKKLGIAQPKER